MQSSNASSDTRVQNRIEAAALERIDADHPNHRTASDGHDLATAGRLIWHP
jgi:hypothetical protein